jgi:hypothetical protein
LSAARRSATITGLSTTVPPEEYAVRCPQCREQAVARMVRHGTQGSYREVYVHFAAELIACTKCGYVRDVRPGVTEDYELWYATEFDGHRVWARDLADLERLIAWISGGCQKSRPPSSRDEYPRWIRTRKHRPELLRRLIRLRDQGPGP